VAKEAVDVLCGFNSTSYSLLFKVLVFLNVFGFLEFFVGFFWFYFGFFN
jgi:hypothetical protein